MIDPPETRYAQTPDGVHLAYQVVGEGPMDLVAVPIGISHVEMDWELPALARFLDRLARFSRVIRFDMRGLGLSDPVTPRDWPTLEHWAQDLLTVLDAVGSKRAALLGGVQGGQIMMFFAATYPERTAALVLAGTTARLGWAPDYPWGLSLEEQQERIARAEHGWPEGDNFAEHETARGIGLVRLTAPSALDDVGFLSWWTRLYRQASKPGASAANARRMMEGDLRHLLPAIQAPALVLCRSDDQLAGPDHARYLADHIPRAKFVELPGQDNLLFVGNSDAAVDEIEEFLTGARQARPSDRALATVLFTDIVGSTQRASELGDTRWRDLITAHDRTVRRQFERFRGLEVHTTGDGFLARFDGPGRAIECACAVRDAVGALGVDVRAGLHTGEIEVIGDDVAGIAVHIGARVAALAGPGEVLVSSTVKDLVVGSGFEFADRGEHELKGVPGTWRLFRVEGSS